MINADEEQVIDQIIQKLETRINSGFVINYNKEMDGNDFIEEASQEEDEDDNDDEDDDEDEDDDDNVINEANDKGNEQGNQQAYARQKNQLFKNQIYSPQPELESMRGQLNQQQILQ